MNKNMRKFLSVLLSLIMLCSVLALPAIAADADGGNVEIAFSVEKHDGTDTAGNTADDIYALTISFKNDHPINAFVMPVYYDSTVFTPIDGTDMSIMEWDYTVDFSAGLIGVGYEAKGDLADANKYNKANALPADRVTNGRGAIAGHGNASSKHLLEIAACDPSDGNRTHFWGGMSLDTIGALYLNYESGANGCNVQAWNEFRPFVTLFFKANEGATQEQINNARFGFYAESTKNCFDSTTESDVTKFYFDATSTSRVPTATSGECTLGGGSVATPVLTKAKSQVKMTATSATTVADAFQFRVISKISDADWNTYFANTGKDGATANAITNVGFVAYKGTAGFDLDTAKAAVTGTAAAGYEVATTDYIQHVDGSDAQFGCLLKITSAETRSDVTYVAFAQYLDADGAAQVVFYDSAFEALLATNYTGIVEQYLAAFPFAG